MPRGLESGTCPSCRGYPDRVPTAAASVGGFPFLQRFPRPFRAVCRGTTGSYVAECVELIVERRGVKVHRVVAGFDCGMVVNPDGVRNQVEGSIIMGMGTALREAVEFNAGRLLNPSFGRYRVPRITDAPQVEVVLAGDPTTQSTGAGEPGMVPIAAAIDNAVYDATGSRIRDLPIVPRLP